jgi:hypothetical protein
LLFNGCFVVGLFFTIICNVCLLVVREFGSLVPWLRSQMAFYSLQTSSHSPPASFD